MNQAQRLENLGLGIARYGVAAFLLLFGAMKFTPQEAEGIRPLIEHSPFMSWLPALLGTRGASDAIGVVELVTGALILARRVRPRLSALGSLLAAGTFALTTSFMFTTPGAFAPDSYLGGFLLKDLILMAASLYAAGEALRAHHEIANQGISSTLPFALRS